MSPFTRTPPTDAAVTDEWVKRCPRRNHHTGNIVVDTLAWTVKPINAGYAAVSAIHRGDYIKVIVSRAIPLPARD